MSYKTIALHQHMLLMRIMEKGLTPKNRRSLKDYAEQMLNDPICLKVIIESTKKKQL